eukprot:GILI01020465.1.p1 GENE.GILI01020465.1~~GILI01020465.1.p1  ORF type:complete len:455 (+),score=98.20 GILI01020465.1:83-1447(+)
MHDERKVKGELDEKTKEQTRQLIAKFREVYDDIFAQKDKGYMGADIIKKIDALLELNPELYSVFNYRRQLLLHGWEVAENLEKERAEGNVTTDAATPAPEEATTAAPAATFVTAKQKQLEDMERELKLNTKILLKDYKIYSAWLHRRWLFNRMGGSMKTIFLAKERGQCETILGVDERNFHAWGYRRWVQNEQRKLSLKTAASTTEGQCTSAQSKSVGDAHNAQERAFTLAKIERNISNFSAWHNRALIFVERLASIGLAADELVMGVGRSEVVATISDPELIEDIIGTIVDEVMGDVELCIKAFFSDPDDQSTWLYAERLVGLLQFACDKLGKGVRTAEDANEMCHWEVRETLLDGSRTVPVVASSECLLLLKECLESCIIDLTECCQALRTEALRTSPTVTKGLKGFQWPTWLLLHLPAAVTDASERKKLWDELSVVDPQRRGYYADMKAKE